MLQEKDFVNFNGFLIDPSDLLVAVDTTALSLNLVLLRVTKIQKSSFYAEILESNAFPSTQNGQNSYGNDPRCCVNRVVQFALSSGVSFSQNDTFQVIHGTFPGLKIGRSRRSDINEFAHKVASNGIITDFFYQLCEDVAAHNEAVHRRTEEIRARCAQMDADMSRLLTLFTVLTREAFFYEDCFDSVFPLSDPNNVEFKPFVHMTTHVGQKAKADVFVSSVPLDDSKMTRTVYLVVQHVIDAVPVISSGSRVYEVDSARPLQDIVAEFLRDHFYCFFREYVMNLPIPVIEPAAG